ncbi:MAG: ABC transporter ATP-binding protein [Rhodospirillales bacterium]
MTEKTEFAASPIITVENITKVFGRTVKAVDDVSFDIMEGEFFALLGPSGCGKTTLLRMIAGFENPTSGRILIDGKDMDGIEPNKRPVNMVFQSYAVFPHMNVARNVAYGLKVTGTPEADIGPRVEEALSLVQLDGYGERMPDALSGGQRQRVALARALVKRPRVLLLDEPLSALDAKLRELMQLELRRLQESVGITFVIVTHDQDEALSMADRIAVMQSGVVAQLADPSTLYEFPTSRFVADFIGKTNLFDGKVSGTSGAGEIVVDVSGIGQTSIPFDGSASGEIALAVRPEKIRVLKEEPSAAEGVVTIPATVSQVAYYGDESHLLLDNPTGVMITANVPNTSRSTRPRAVEGDKLWLSWDAADTLVLDR